MRETGFTNKKCKDCNEQDFNLHWEQNFSRCYNKNKIKEGIKFLTPVLGYKNQKILDVGCGDGVHLNILSKYCNDYQIYGIDISEITINKLQNLYQDKKNVFLAKADALKLPFKDQEFDIVFSFGVITYTKSPENALKEMVRVLKKGGYLGLWVYPRCPGFKHLLFESVRKICNNVPFFKKFIASVVVLLLPCLPTKSRISLFNSSWRDCFEVVSVNLFPEILYYFTEDEIKKLFIKLKINIVNEDKNEPITLWGRKE